MGDWLSYEEAAGYVAMETGLSGRRPEAMLQDAIDRGAIRGGGGMASVRMFPGGMTVWDPNSQPEGVHRGDLIDWVRGLKHGAGKRGGRPASQTKGGRPTAADWETVKDALKIKIGEMGVPDRENPAGWRTQADVEKWVAELLQIRMEDAADSTIRDNTKRLLAKIEREESKGTET